MVCAFYLIKLVLTNNILLNLNLWISGYSLRVDPKAVSRRGGDGGGGRSPVGSHRWNWLSTEVRLFLTWPLPSGLFSFYMQILSVQQNLISKFWICPQQGAFRRLEWKETNCVCMFAYACIRGQIKGVVLALQNHSVSLGASPRVPGGSPGFKAPNEMSNLSCFFLEPSLPHPTPRCWISVQ